MRLLFQMRDRFFRLTTAYAAKVKTMKTQTYNRGDSREGLQQRFNQMVPKRGSNAPHMQLQSTFESVAAQLAKCPLTHIR